MPRSCAIDELLRDDRIVGEEGFLAVAAYVRAQIDGRQVVGKLTPLGNDALFYCSVKLESKEWAGDCPERLLWQDVPRWTVTAS